MAEMFSSAVVQEAVNQIVSRVLNKHEGTSSAEEQLERLEMAHIKLEAALETSRKWHITDASLLRWQKKLKRVAQECDHTLLKCRQHFLEQEVKDTASFPKRIAHAASSFISSIFYGNSSNELSRSVRRFEWFADGAGEFLRFVESGGTPRCYAFFDPLVRHLLAGNALEYKSVMGSKHHLLRIHPLNIAGCGPNARFIFQHKDDSAPEDDLLFTLSLHLSESIDIIGVAIRCLHMHFFTPHFKSTVEIVRKELSQLPTQDFSKKSNVYLCPTKHWNNIVNIYTKWFSTNPHYKLESSSASLEPVIMVYLERHVSLSEYHKQRAATQRKRSPPEEFPLLKLRLAFMPHVSLEEHHLPAIASSVVEAIGGEKQQRFLHTNVTLEQVDKIMLPKAIDRLRRSAEARTYQMLWKSRHGGAYLQVEKESMQMTTKRRAIAGATNDTMLQQQQQEQESFKGRTDEVCAFLNLWAGRLSMRHV